MSTGALLAARPFEGFHPAQQNLIGKEGGPTGTIPRWRAPAVAPSEQRATAAGDLPSTLQISPDVRPHSTGLVPRTEHAWCRPGTETPMPEEFSTEGIASIDLFVVPTISFKLLYGLLILRHDRGRILWIGVTRSPTSEWIARQVSEACGWEPVPDYLVRDRDRVYGEAFTRRIRATGIRDRPTAPRSPWQNGYAERLIGSDPTRVPRSCDRCRCRKSRLLGVRVRIG